jgi:hypothetical protein
MVKGTAHPSEKQGPMERKLLSHASALQASWVSLLATNLHNMYNFAHLLGIFWLKPRLRVWVFAQVDLTG